MDKQALYELTYISFRKFSLGDIEVKKILETSQKNNCENGVTGVLVYSKTMFMQILEGKQDAVKELYRKIEGDQRHDAVLLLSECVISKRRFEKWYMAGKKLAEEDLEYLTEFSKEEKEKLRSLLKGENPGEVNNLISKFFH